MSFTKVDEREKQAALEEEQARLKALKVLQVLPAVIQVPERHVVTVLVFHSLGKEAQGAFQEALLPHHRHISNLHQRRHHQHSTSHRPLLHTQLLQWVPVTPG